MKKNIDKISKKYYKKIFNINKFKTQFYYTKNEV